MEFTAASLPLSDSRNTALTFASAMEVPFLTLKTTPWPRSVEDGPFLYGEEYSRMDKAHNATKNDSSLFIGDIAHNFFDVYFSTPRFVFETLMAVVAIFANIFTMVLLFRASEKPNGTAYRTLFYNLSVANAVCCFLSYVANNTLFLFERQLVYMMQEPEGICRVFLLLMAVMFVSVAFGIESSITMLGFIAIQYRSVSRPLVHWAIARQKMAYVFLAISWVLTFLFGCVPFGILIKMSRETECTDDMRNHGLSIVIVGATIALTIEGVTYVLVIVLSTLIYLKLRHYGRGFWNVRFDNQIRGQKRTFRTTLMLFVTLVIFSLPYMILYVVTLKENNISHVQESVLIHYMTLLPYLKFLIDPVIYGMRMREVKESWFKLLLKCGLGKCACPREELHVSTPQTPPPYLMHHVTFV